MGDSEYRNIIMNFNSTDLLDDAEILEEDIYDLLSSIISSSERKDKAISVASKIITNISKLDDIILEFACRLDKEDDKNIKKSNHLEEGRSKLENFKFADVSNGPITEEFTTEELLDLFSDTVEEDSLDDEHSSKDFQKLVRNFVGSKMQCD